MDKFKKLLLVWVHLISSTITLLSMRSPSLYLRFPETSSEGVIILLLSLHLFLSRYPIHGLDRISSPTKQEPRNEHRQEPRSEGRQMSGSSNVPPRQESPRLLWYVELLKHCLGLSVYNTVNKCNL